MPPMHGKAPDDPARAGGGERVLVVDAGVGDADHHFARVELVERHLDESAEIFFSTSLNTVGLEFFHELSLPNESPY